MHEELYTLWCGISQNAMSCESWRQAAYSHATLGRPARYEEVRGSSGGSLAPVRRVRELGRTVPGLTLGAC